MLCVTLGFWFWIFGVQPNVYLEYIFWLWIWPRLGPRSGFASILKAQCHCVATALMNIAAGSVHENVLGYDDSHLEEKCKHKIQMAKSLVSSLSILSMHLCFCTPSNHHQAPLSACLGQGWRQECLEVLHPGQESTGSHGTRDGGAGHLLLD